MPYLIDNKSNSIVGLDNNDISVNNVQLNAVQYNLNILFKPGTSNSISIEFQTGAITYSLEYKVNTNSFINNSESSINYTSTVNPDGTILISAGFTLSSPKSLSSLVILPTGNDQPPGNSILYYVSLKEVNSNVEIINSNTVFNDPAVWNYSGLTISNIKPINEVKSDVNITSNIQFEAVI